MTEPAAGSETRPRAPGLAVGLIVNPVAGIGGAVGLKGSDGVEVQALARQLGGEPRAGIRARRALVAAGSAVHGFRWFTWAGSMGADCLADLGVAAVTVGAAGVPPTREDTQRAARALRDAGVDLLVFSGGDGTARDLLDALGDSLPVLGIPAGVKMHSGVFATTPERAGELLARLASGGLVNAVRREVRDLDEAALRTGTLRPRYFGELLVPEPGGYLQHTKERGRENESLAVAEIVAWLEERIRALELPVVLGPGSTVGALKTALGFEGSLLGFDVWERGRVVARDVNARWLLEHLHDCVVVLSFTRGQGFLLGRGNQQLSAPFLERIGKRGLWVIGTRTKLASLEGRPLLVDTDDADLDAAFSGLIEIVAGYEDVLLYRIASHA